MRSSLGLQSLAVLIVSMGAVHAQTPLPSPQIVSAPSRELRSRLQQAYRDWRLTDPNLESDAAGDLTVSQRSAKVAVEAAKYFDARKAYFDALAGELDQVAVRANVLSNTAAPAPSESPYLARYITMQSGVVAKNLAIIPKDSDAGFQQLRRALEREEAALNVLQGMLKDVPEPATGTGLNAVNAHYAKVAEEVRGETRESAEIATAWASYYRALAAGAREISVSKNEPKSEVAAVSNAVTPSINAVTPSRAAVQDNPVQPDAPVRTASAVAVASIEPAGRASHDNGSPNTARVIVRNIAGGEVRSSAPGFTPLSRYVGSWVYPTSGEHYHGAHPESVELEVRQEIGQISGTMHAKFRLPPPGASNPIANPIVQFTFAGGYQIEKMQTFAFEAPDGTKGTLELIPAATFNLLEINFTSPEVKGKITHGNFFLIRK